MSEDRKRILDLLAAGKITADEAERLIAALAGASRADEPREARRPPKYLRVVVDADGENGQGRAKVNVRVPMQLLRAGVRLGALIPRDARDEVNRALRENGIGIDVTQIKPENLEAILEQLQDFSVDIDDEHATVRVFCE
ncbi:MAG TPA: hypothetical protein VKU90_16815 [Caulobacteraceae bacterium]|nr:hypothetical protein [Caulobacteraceae bacterium]